MPSLEQTTRLLTLDDKIAQRLDGMATYTARDEDTGEVTTLITVDVDTAEALGYPAQLTVTIHPGDQLNPQD